MLSWLMAISSMWPWAIRLLRNCQINYLVIIEGEPGNYSAYVPDLPGCITVGESIHEVQENIKEAISLYAEEAIGRGLVLQSPTTQALFVSAA